MIIALRIILSVMLFSSGLLFAERLVIYAFDPREVDPASLELQMDATRYTSPSGFDLVIWQAPPEPGQPTVFYLHGNAGNLANRARRFERFLSRGYGLVAPAYPGSSGSGGWPSEPRLTDAISETYTALRSGELTGAPLEPIVYGESLGAAVALQILRDGPAPRAVILEAPFTSLSDIAEHLGSWAAALTPLMSSNWESLEAAPALSAPLLVMHGAKDPLVPIDQGRAVFDAASSTDKEFYVVKEAGHIDVWKVVAQQHLFGWLSQH